VKQRITQGQWDELTPEQHTRYIEWTLKKSAETGDHTTVYRSIGHLIWFLDDHIEKFDGWWAINKSRYPDVWSIESKYDVGFGNEDRAELVDALWMAVKATLRQERNEDEHNH
jgi:hypothetical protein